MSRGKDGGVVDGGVVVGGEMVNGHWVGGTWYTREQWNEKLRQEKEDARWQEVLTQLARIEQKLDELQKSKL